MDGIWFFQVFQRESISRDSLNLMSLLKFIDNWTQSDHFGLHVQLRVSTTFVSKSITFQIMGQLNRMKSIIHEKSSMTEVNVTFRTNPFPSEEKSLDQIQIKVYLNIFKSTEKWSFPLCDETWNSYVHLFKSNCLRTLHESRFMKTISRMKCLS